MRDIEFDHEGRHFTAWKSLDERPWSLYHERRIGTGGEAHWIGERPPSDRAGMVALADFHVRLIADTGNCYGVVAMSRGAGRKVHLARLGDHALDPARPPYQRATNCGQRLDTGGWSRVRPAPGKAWDSDVTCGRCR